MADRPPRPRLLLRLALCLACGLFGGHAPLLAQARADAEAPQSDLPVVEPSHHIGFPEAQMVWDVRFAPDGRSAYVRELIYAIDVWQVIVSFWPEVLGGLVALLVLVTALVVRRILRRPQRRGDLHCRACNYNLAGVVNQNRCPECGADTSKRRPRLGRSTRRRLIPVLTPAALALGAYASMLAAGLPRDGAAAGWFSWPSAWVHQQANARNWKWMQVGLKDFDRVIEIELATGRIARHIFIRRWSGMFPMALSPDGKSFFLADFDEGVTQLDAHTGAVIRSIRLGPGCARPETPGVLGFANGGRTVYMGYMDEQRDVDVIAAWDLESGTLTRLIETPVNFAWPGRALLIPADAPRFLVASNFNQAYQGGEYKAEVRAPGADPALVLTLASGNQRTGGAASVAAPVITPDGSMLFISTMTDGIAGFDLESGQSLGLLRGPAREPMWTSLLVSSDGNRLICPTNLQPGSILVRNMPERRWEGRLTVPGTFFNPVLSASPDGRWLAALGMKPNQSGNNVVSELLLYDLSKLPAPPR